MVAFVVVILIGRLAYLQLVQGEYYWSLSEENRVRVEEVRAPRGRILDRNGVVLADNDPSYRVTLDTRHAAFRRDPQALAATVASLAEALELDPQRLQERVERQRRESSLPVVIGRAVPFAQVSRIEERTVRLEGVTVEVTPVRRYPRGQLACHLIGYLGEVQTRDLEENPDGPYRVGHLIGRTGVEREYESELRGIDGKAFAEVDVHGRRTSFFPELPSTPAIPGHDLVLTIDARLQEVAEAALASIVAEGARPSDPPPPACLVALDPSNGEVLALASQPGFDPNIFLGGLTPEEYQALLSPDKPQHNRAIASTYPPGSTFKAVTSLAGLESGLIDRNTTFDPCFGSYQFGNRRFGCWKPSGHGVLSQDGALRQSCDVYYYQLGLRLGMEKLSEYAHRFGLADRTRIDIPGERADLIPDAEWYRQHRDGGWGRGVVLNLAIGQGELLISPIALARFYGGLGMGGQIYQPHVLLEIRGEDGAVLRDTRRDDWRAGRIPASAENIQIIREGLEQVVMHGQGTGGRARVGEIRIAGKTGTAENPGKDHALFACYAPADAPRIVVVVIAEEAGHGGAVAAPVAQKVLEEFFLGRDTASNGFEISEDLASREVP